MRVGELVVLKWKDIDFDKRTIHITKTYFNPDNNTIKFEPSSAETKSSRRKIVVSKVVSDILKNIRRNKKNLLNI